MKRKFFSIFITLVLVLSFSLVAAAVSADGPPTIDGVISTGEWDDATVIAVETLNDLETRLGHPLTIPNVVMGTVSVIAYADYMYVLFDVVDSGDHRDILVSGSGNDQIGININPTPGVGTWGFPYDLIFETSALSGGQYLPDDGGHHQLPWNPKVNSGTIDGWATRWFPNDAQENLPVNLESATVYSGGKRVTEWKMPLASSAFPSPGDTLKVGGAIDVGDGNSYVYPVGLDWNTPATFEDIVVKENSTVGLTINVPDIVAISVTPTNIDFGTLLPGEDSAEFNITVQNIGTRKVDVDADVSGLGGDLFYDNLQLKNLTHTGSYTLRVWPVIVDDLVMGAYEILRTYLPVPLGYTPRGGEGATLIFEATAASP